MLKFMKLQREIESLAYGIGTGTDHGGGVSSALQVRSPFMSPAAGFYDGDGDATDSSSVCGESNESIAGSAKMRAELEREVHFGGQSSEFGSQGLRFRSISLLELYVILASESTHRFLVSW